jgi:hypothetical protein
MTAMPAPNFGAGAGPREGVAPSTITAKRGRNCGVWGCRRRCAGGSCPPLTLPPTGSAQPNRLRASLQVHPLSPHFGARAAL